MGRAQRNPSPSWLQEMMGIAALNPSYGCHDEFGIDYQATSTRRHGRGVGSELLQVAKRACERLQLWTFQRNLKARRFYEARGFALVEETDGAGNEEKEPDARYLWTRA